MFLSGMQLGFTAEEVGRMSLTRLRDFIEAFADLGGAGDGPSRRMATQADIDTILG